jgi:hypothetical protein
MRDIAARTRAGLTDRPSAAAPEDPRVHVGVGHLRGLEPRAKALTFLPRQPARSVLNGAFCSLTITTISVAMPSATNSMSMDAG